MSVNCGTEESAIEALINDGLAAEDWAYYNAFHLAKLANWQRQSMTITECRAAAVEVLRKHFILRVGK